MKTMRSQRLVLAVALTATAFSPRPLLASEDEQPPVHTTKGGARLELVTPPAAPMGPTSLPFAVPGPSQTRSRDSASAGGLKGIQAVAMSEGQARLMLNGRPLSVRPGDSIGSDIVRTISPGRIVLSRPAASGGGEGIVVVSFDAQGRSKVRVYAAADPTAAPPPQGR